MNKDNCALKLVDEIIPILYMFGTHRAYHQERPIVSIQPLLSVILKTDE